MISSAAFREIPFTSGIYSITSTGIVKNNRTGNTLKPHISNGYWQVSRIKCESGFIYSKIPVHRLLAITYIPNPNNLPVVNHIDGNKLNNALSNLEWCTTQENFLHAIRLGLVGFRKTPVQQIDKITGRVVAEYPRIKDAIAAAGGSINISYACRNYPRATAGGYLWRHVAYEKLREIAKKQQKATPEDLTGKVFRGVTVHAFIGKNSKGHRAYTCVCTCGKDVRLTDRTLQKPTAYSCTHAKVITTSPPRLLGSLKRKYPSTYSSWTSMRRRCSNLEDPNYGGRGIAVCSRWNTFTNFVEDMGERPAGLTLDRIDPDKGYSPENCRWADASTQATNQRRFKEGGEFRKVDYPHYSNLRRRYLVMSESPTENSTYQLFTHDEIQVLLDSKKASINDVFEIYRPKQRKRFMRLNPDNAANT